MCYCSCYCSCVIWCFLSTYSCHLYISIVHTTWLLFYLLPLYCFLSHFYHKIQLPVTFLPTLDVTPTIIFSYLNYYSTITPLVLSCKVLNKIHQHTAKKHKDNRRTKQRDKALVMQYWSQLDLKAKGKRWLLNQDLKTSIEGADRDRQIH